MTFTFPAGGITVGGLINNSGTVTVGSAGGGSVRLNGGIGPNVTRISLNATGAANGSSIGAIEVGSGNLLIENTGNKNWTLGNITGTGNLSFAISNTLTPVVGSINNTGTITNAPGGTTTLALSGAIGSNVTGVTQNSATSQLTLSGTNTYTGATTISDGTLSVGAATNLGAGAANLVFDGGTLQITGTVLTSVTGIGHTVFTNDGKTVGLDINSSTNTFTFDQVLNQTTGGLTKLGAGTLVLNQSNTYTGATTISAGTLRSANNGALGTTASVSVSGAGTLAVNYGGISDYTDAQLTTLLGKTTLGTGSTFAFDNTNGSGAYTGALATPSNLTKLGGNTIALSGPVSLTSASAQTIGNTSGTLTISGNVTKTAGDLTILTSQTQATAISGNLTVGGRISTINAGTLTLSGDNSGTNGWDLGSTNVVVDSANALGSTGTINFGTGMATTGALTFTANGAATDPSSRFTVDPTGNYNIASSGGATVTLASALAGNGAAGFNVRGGTVILGNAGNSFAGSTSITSGTLSVAGIGNAGNNSQLGTNGTINLGNATQGSGTLAYTGTGETTDKVINLASTTAGQTIQANNASGLLKFTSDLTATGAGIKTLTLRGTGAGELAGAIVNSTGATSLTKNDAGIWTLSGNNTYTGATTVTAGTLVFRTTAAKASGTVTAAAAGTVGLGVGAVSGDYTDANVAALFNTNTLAGFSLNAASGVAIDTTAGNFTQSTALTAARSLTKLGANTLTLTGTNTYSGGTTISAGTLQLGSGGTTGSLSTTGTIVNNGTLTINRSNAVVQGIDFSSAAITGIGSLNLTGSGTTTLNAANTYAGGTTVSAGKLLVNNLTGSGTGTEALSIGATATLGGSGFIGSVTSISGTLSPGNSPGTLTFDNAVTLQNGSTTAIEINAVGTRGTAFDGVNFNGGLTVVGGTLTFNISTHIEDGAILNIFDGSALSSSFTSVSATGTGGYGGTFAYNGSNAYVGSFGDQTLSLALATGELSFIGAAIPEPSTYAAIFGALALGFAACCRRSKKA